MEDSMEAFRGPDNAHYEVWFASPVGGVDFNIPEGGVVACLDAKQRSIKIKAKLGPELRKWREGKSAERQEAAFAAIDIIQDEQYDARITLDIGEATASYFMLLVTHHDPLFSHYHKQLVTKLRINNGWEELGAVLTHIAKFLFYIHHQPSPAHTGEWEIDIKLQKFQAQLQLHGASRKITWTRSDAHPSNTHMLGPVVEIAQPGSRDPSIEVPPMVLGTGRLRREVKEAYALHFMNKSDQDLYVWAFEFDLQTYAIRVSVQGV